MIYISSWTSLKFSSPADAPFGHDRYSAVHKALVVVIYFISEFFFDLFIFCDKRDLGRQYF